MKCVARKRCQARAGEYIRTFKRGEVFDFDECPPHFEPIEGVKAVAINFENASEDELREAEYDLDTLKEYIRLKYDKNPANRGKKKTVSMLLDCRYRSLDHIDLNKVM